MTLIGIGIKIAQQVYKHRQSIYRTLVAQDRAISTSLKAGRWSKAASYGWRTGAAVGGLVGPLITNNAPDTPGNELQTPNCT